MWYSFNYNYTFISSCLSHILDFRCSTAILGITYWLSSGVLITSCLVELHFGLWDFVPILGFSFNLTISPFLISGCFLFLLAAFWRCQLIQRWFVFTASLGLVWVMLCSVELYLLIMSYIYIYICFYPFSVIFI